MLTLKNVKIDQSPEPIEPGETYDILAGRMGNEPHILDLEILVRKCKAKDSAAWAQLVERFQALVWSSIYRIGLRNEDAEDTFQKVFLILYKNLDRIDSARALPKWLSTTAVREAIRLQRQNRDKATTALDAIENLDEMLASEDVLIEDVAIAAAESDAIRKVISRLPGKCPELLSMLYSEDQNSYEDVRTHLGIPPGSIGPTRSRCIERLRQALISSKYLEIELIQDIKSS
jgi:RNA polymerase sigma factor (sigma-70 family)